MVDPAEGQVFHNRLTHSLKVAQIARRLAERLVRDQPEECEALGGLNPDVVETAALAHDLGHPPFGHVAETRLNELVLENGEDGFEGNAQTFRIVTKLALKAPGTHGLDLTRASLNAILKYPWPRDPIDPDKKRKWGVYETEKSSFDLVRAVAGGPDGDNRSLEAEVMNIADDIAYAIHDLEDFYRAGLIPLEILGGDPSSYQATDEQQRFLSRVFEHWKVRGRSYDEEECRTVMADLVTLLPTDERYSGTPNQRVIVRAAVSSLIGQYAGAVRVDTDKPGISFESGRDDQDESDRYGLEVSLLKQLTWQYVIKNPSLGSQQFGRRRVIEELFDIYFDAIKKDSDWGHLVPPRFRRPKDPDGTRIPPARRAADIVSSFADYEALAAFRRLTGQSIESLLPYSPL